MNILSQPKLPREIGNHVFSFLIPDPSKIKFCSPSWKECVMCKETMCECWNTRNSNKYLHAYLEHRILENDNGRFLCQMPKLNGKHRYYISKIEYNPSTYMQEYNTVYVGKNITLALLFLFS